MSEQKIPSNLKQLIQSNVGDYRGNLYQTFNVDLDSSNGVIKTSPRLFRAVNRTLNIWFGGSVFTALQIHDGYYYAINNDDAIRCLTSNDPTVQSNWSAVPGTWNFGSLYTDMTSFKGLLLTSTSTNIASYDGTTVDDDWWTTVALGTALTASKTHTMEVLRTGADTLFITDGNKIRYYNTAAAGTIITLDTLMTSNCLTPSLDRMWVGTYTEVENSAYVYEIQVGNAQSTQAYEVEGRVCLTMFTYNNTPFVITERGVIQAYNGVGFVTVAEFPWANQSKVMEGCRPGLVQDSPTALAIHPKGARVNGKYAYIYVNADDEYITSDVLLSKRGASGVWVLDLETYSLTHKYALTITNTDVAGSYGTHKVDRSGPVLITNTPETRIMVATTAVDEGIWMEGDSASQGYFITTRHEATSVSDAFESFTVKCDQLDIDELITVKYKEKQYSNLPLEVQDITWLNANQFTTTATLTNIEVGDEVELVKGSYAGNICVIEDIVGTTTKTVTVDTTFGVLNATSDAYFDNFKLAGTVTPEDGEYKKLGVVNGNSAFRQHKVIMKGNVTVREVISKSNSKEQQ